LKAKAKVNLPITAGSDCSLDRTRRISEELLETHRESFGPDFQKNKQALAELAVVPSKQLRNHIAGYIARMLRERSPPAQEPEESPSV
jgi:small subunit ribosomal protein S17e